MPYECSISVTIQLCGFTPLRFNLPVPYHLHHPIFEHPLTSRDTACRVSTVIIGASIGMAQNCGNTYEYVK